MLSFVAAKGRPVYECWLWEEDQGQFARDPALSSLGSFGIDYDNEIISSYFVFSADETITEEYKYIDGILTMTYEFRAGFFDPDDPYQGYEITHELIDGKWVMTRKIAIGDRRVRGG